MTGTNDKIRGLFLAALMVLSVFAMTVAFSGSVAAANQPSVDSAVEYNGNIEVAFNEGVQEVNSTNGLDAANVSVWVNDTEYSVGTLSSDASGGQLVILNGQITSGDIDPIDDVKVEIHSDLEAATGPDETFGAGNITVDVTSRHLTTEAAANNPEQVYQGEIIAFEPDGTVNTAIVIEEVGGSIQLDGSTESHGAVLPYDTDNLATGGNYSYDFQDDGSVGYMEINDLQLSASADDTEISDEDPLKVDISAIRGGSDVTAYLYDSDGDVAQTETATLSSSKGEATIDFGTQDVDTYDNVTVVDHSTGVEATTDSIEVTEAADAEAEFTSSDFADNRGDVIEIEVELTETDVATLGLGDYDEDGYAFNFTLQDGDDSGNVTLEWNTFLADGSGAELSVADSDDDYYVNGSIQSDVDAHSGTDSDIIQAGTYDLDVRRGAGTNGSVASQDVATASVQDRSTDGVSIWTTPGQVQSELTSVSAIHDRMGENVTMSSTIADGDWIVHEIEASGLEGALGNFSTSNTNATQDFLNITAQQSNEAGEEVVGLKVGQSNAQKNRDPKYWTPGASSVSGQDVYGNLSVVPDPANDTYYAILNSNAFFTRDTSGAPFSHSALEDGDELATNFTVYSYNTDDSNYGLVTENEEGDFEHETVLGTFAFSDAEATVNTQRNDTVRVQAASNQTISGTTTVAPGTTLSVRAQTKSGASNAFLLPETVEVSDDGTWEAEYDFSTRAIGTEFTVDVRREGSSLLDEEAEGLIQGEAVVSALEFSDQDSTGNSVVVDAATVSEGGFVAIHEGSASGDILGWTRYIDPGEDATNLAVALDPALSDGSHTLVAMPHMDEDNNQAFNASVDGAYTEAGAPVTASASVQVGAEETTSPPPTSPPPTSPPPTSPPPTSPPPETTTPGEQGPGFGVAIALIALLAAALLAVRRRS